MLTKGDDNSIAILNNTLELKHTLTGASLNQLCLHSEAETKIALDIAIVRACTKLNLKYNLQDHQIEFIVKEMLRVYKHETLEDIMLCLNKGVSGQYNNDGIIYTVDISIVNMWMRKHLAEKADLRERHHQEQKYPSGNSDGLLGLLATKKDELGITADEKKESEMKEAVRSYKPDHKKQAEINAKIDKQIEHGRKEEINRKRPK